MIPGSSPGQGQGRPVVIYLRRKLNIVNQADAKQGNHAGGPAHLGDGLPNAAPQLLHQVRAPGHNNAEIVPFKVAAVLISNLLQAARDLNQQLVARAPSMKLVEQPEVHDIHGDQAIFIGARPRNKQPGFLYKSPGGIQTC